MIKIIELKKFNAVYEKKVYIINNKKWHYVLMHKHSYLPKGI